jgi:hypothetical protein
MPLVQPDPTDPVHKFVKPGARNLGRRFKVTFKDGETEIVVADSLDEAYAKARRSARRQISTREQGRKVVADVHVEPGQGPPPPRT